MKRFASIWWVVAAAVMAGLQAIFAIGNLIEDDGGPLYGQVVLLAVAIGGTILVGVGLAYRMRNRRVGSTLVAIGVLPSVLGILLFWFPPAVLYGLLAIAVVWFASRDAAAARRKAIVS